MVGRTPEGKIIVAGTFVFVSGLGLHLDLVADYLDHRGFMMHWIDFYVEAIKQKWPPERTLRRLQSTVRDVYGPDFEEEWVERMQESLLFLYENYPDLLPEWPMSALERIREYLDLFEEARVIYESDATWETKYDLIFSDQISKPMNKLFRLDYYDPDTTYEEDLTAWFRAAEDKVDDLSKIVDP